MTNQEKEESGQIPPKIKLKNGNGTQPSSGEETVAGQPPQAARPISAPKSDTSRVEIPQQELDKAPPAPTHDETMRVVLPKAEDVEMGTLRKKTADKPLKTIKLKRPQSLSGEGEQTGAEEAGQMKTIVEARPVMKPKEDTSRIDISKAQMPPTQEQVDSAKDETMKVILEELSGKGDTGKVNFPGAPKRTVVIKRGDANLPGAETVATSAEEEKSATAKLDIPDTITETPGARKTIRIKRAGSEAGEGAGKTLKISRAEPGKSAALPTIAEDAREAIEFGTREQGPHAIFAIAALFAVIISGVLIYIMCAHMPFGASLPWPGKIITEWQGPTRMI
jgi:hypothetical protein